MIELRNGPVRLTIEEPGKGYVFPRFDQTAKIRELWYDDILFSSSEVASGGDPATTGAGFFAEFDFTEPAGYGGPGSHFHKIGVGELEGRSAEYSSLEELEGEFFSFEYDATDSGWSCAYRSPEIAGRSHTLRKTVAVHDDGFTITAEMQNTGRRSLEFSEYVHNFLQIGHNPIGPGYRLSFPFPLRTDGFIETVDPGLRTHIEGNTVTFPRSGDEVFFFTNLCPGPPVPAGWELFHDGLRMALREECSRDSSLVNLWGLGHVVSPELYLQFSVEPGESARWRRRYHVGTSSEKT